MKRKGTLGCRCQLCSSRQVELMPPVCGGSYCLDQAAANLEFLHHSWKLRLEQQLLQLHFIKRSSGWRASDGWSH